MPGEPTTAAPLPDSRAPLLIACNDLFVIPRLQDAARAEGLEPVVVDSPEAFGAGGEAEVRRVPLTEPLEGSDAGFLRAVVELQPALILLDLGSDALPWARWIQVLKTSSATRAFPLLAFGPHVDASRLEQARALGADRVMPRSAFLAALPRILGEAAQLPDTAQLAQACRHALDDRVVQGLRLVEHGDYFAAHELLEAAVLSTKGAEAGLYRVLLQLAVAYLHLQRRNLRGARKMLLRLRRWLQPLPDVCRGVDVRRLRREIGELQAALDAAAQDPAFQVPTELLRPIPMTGSVD